MELIHGFEFISEKELPELGGKLREAVYRKNGAKLLFIDREDSNKTFAIAFKTIPEDSTGVFHIIEHSVLCGSEKYPVKEPFVELLKGSLKTFLNAFTFPDKTMYPVSSRNDKDFLNLTKVYMDAVLHPVAMTKPDIFYQEGWHHELHSKDEEMTYKGVVFNEMKGAYSSADELEMELMSSLLYPGSTYGLDSGGNPDCIPDLTFEQFRASHARYYHPSNARIILDGSVNLDEVLSLLDSFLSEYDYLDVNSDIPMVAPIGHVENSVEYEIAPNEDPAGKCRVCLGFMASDFSDRRTITALSVAIDAIAGTNEAPFKKAMLDLGICEDVNFISYDGIQQNSLLLELKNVKAEDVKRAEELALSTLRGVLSRGIDKKALTASFNTLEFSTREMDMTTFPQGIAFAIRALDTWLYDGDPHAALTFDDDFKYLREALDTDYYEKLLEKIVLESNHSATLFMYPSATLGEAKAKAEREKLDAARAKMTDEEIDNTIALTASLEAWQASEDTPEALATLPRLELSDIERLPERHPYSEGELESVPVIFTEANSRGITYTNLLFDISDFTEAEIFTASLLTDLMKNVETDTTSALDLQTELKTELGSFGANIIVVERNGVLTPYMQVSSSALNSKLDSVVKLTDKILLHSKYEDKNVIEKIVKQIKTSAAEGIAASGHSAAIGRSSAYINAEAAISEYVDGIESYLKIKELALGFDKMADGLVAALTLVASRIFTKKRLTVFYTGSENSDFIRSLISVFPEGCDFVRGSKIKPFGKRCEGILIPATVAYAAKVGPSSKDGETSSGALGVIRSVLSYGYLWGAIRVQGGAYGAGFIKRKNGTAGFYTYRDPNPARSVGCFDGSAEFLRGFAESGADITSFIIGAIGDSEPLITPKVLSALSMGTYLRGDTFEKRVKERDEMLNITKEDILRIADVIENISELGGVTVVGGKEKLDSMSDILTTIIEI